MNTPSPRQSLKSRLAAFAQRLGLIERGPHSITLRASHLQLPLAKLPLPRTSLSWCTEPQLQRLAELPRSALSGPVQEDKSEAHAMLVKLIKREEVQIPDFDLRRIDGVSAANPALLQHSSFESFANSEDCRKIRLISYNDFIRTLTLPLPGYLTSDAIQLRQASWYGQRIFWAGQQYSEAFVCAIAYARMRELEIKLPALLTRYSLNQAGLAAFQQHYYALAVPEAVWHPPEFMTLLVDTATPYARLSFQGDGAPEILLLPKASNKSAALGEGLLMAGTSDAIAYFSTLSALTIQT